MVEELPRELSAPEAFLRLSHLPHCCFLDSVQSHPKLARYSFIAADPFDVFSLGRRQSDPLAKLNEWLHCFRTETLDGLPPFQGGAAGVFCYEFGRCYERIPVAMHDEFGIPLCVLAAYDVVVAFDHVAGQVWIVSHGWPAAEGNARRARAEQRLREFLTYLSSSRPRRSALLTDPHATAHGLTAPQYETRLGPAWVGNFDGLGFRSAVNRIREYIAAGDVFQVNLAQRLLRRAACDAIDLYMVLREANEAPFAGYFDLGPAQVLSSSPERFLQVDHGRVQTRPIKGTRRRTGDADSDALMRQELLSSQKDRAENIMIVDLLRNDLSRICKPATIHVDQLCGLEEYKYVLHLVSVIEGQLKTTTTASDLMAAIFPGGSITGAPKVRAMEIIAELEPTVRGPYCGSLGYFGFDGQVDLNILIRTITASRGWWQLQFGGGIVYDSDPYAEEEETWTKAEGMVRAIERATRQVHSHTERLRTTI